MIEEFATVIDVGSKDQHIIRVQSNVKSTCSGCNQLDNCGSGLISKAMPQKKLLVDLVTDVDVDVGDIIIIGLTENSFLKAAAQVYLLPILGLIVFSAIGQYLFIERIFSSELYSIFLGCFGGYTGYRLARFLQNNSISSKALQPIFLRKQQK